MVKKIYKIRCFEKSSLAQNFMDVGAKMTTQQKIVQKYPKISAGPRSVILKTA